jgi:hypothetical protein
MRKLLFLSATTAFILYGSVYAQSNISINDAGKNIGKRVSLCGKVSGGRFLANTKPTLLNLEGSTSNELTIIINPQDRKNFPYKPEEYFVSKNVCVTGKVTESNGKPQLSVRSPQDFELTEGGEGIEIKPMDLSGFNRYFNEED